MRLRLAYASAVLAVAVLVSLGSLGTGLTTGTPFSHSGSAPGVDTSVASGVAPSTTVRASASASGLDRVLALEAGLKAKGLDPARIHLPNLLGAVQDIHQTVAPSYTDAPAPMGVADIGLINESGVLTPYELNTTSVAGTLNITNLESLYVDGDGPTTYGVQLNSVAANVTVFGNDTYQYWSQNYVDYTPSTQQLVFGDEVWNFSNLSGLFPENSVYEFSPNGSTNYFPYLYQGYGPAITIGYPFSLTLYLNTTTIADRPALYFNYSVSNATVHRAASFDWLIFNSTVGTPTSPALTPQYQADGYGYDPIGLINDMEIDILGNDDGDTTAFYEANATVALHYLNETSDQLQTVPSAYNAGAETGETSVGLLVYSSGGTNPVAEVRSGPAFVGGLWNYSTGSGAVPVRVDLTPTNSFIFATPGTSQKNKEAQWIPTPPVVPTVFYLPTHGTYFLNFILSDHLGTTRTVTTTTVPVSLTITLPLDPARGMDTPLFALNNSELAAISSGGNGTAASPYLIDDNQVAPIDTAFAQWDDYLFPVFPGLLIANTTAYVQVTPPPLLINIPAFEFGPPYVGPEVAGMNLPTTNNLGIQFFDASNITLVDGAGITGWMSVFQTEYPESSVLVWDCSHVLIASNTFDDQGNALLLYGGSGNTIWDNTFVPGLLDTTSPGSIDDSGANLTGVNESESGDLIYDNAFEVALSALTPPYDPFLCAQFGECQFVAYADAWNVSKQPATDQRIVNGWVLTGSIIDTSYQGGSYWATFNGTIPYTDGGLILTGGDYVPLVPAVTYPVTFTETGLASGTEWNVTVAGATHGSTTSTIQVELANGTYPIEFAGPAGDVATAPPNVTVAGGPAAVGVTFAPGATLTVAEIGLSVGTEWNASVVGAGTDFLPDTATGDTATLVFDLPAGNYTVTAAATGYSVAPASSPVQLPGSGLTVPFVFTLLPGSLHLQVVPATAFVWVNGRPVALVGGAVVLTVPAGVASVVASASGYDTYYNNVSVPTQKAGYLNVTLTAAPSAGERTLLLALVVGLGILAVIFLVGMIVYARRSRSRPPPPAAAPAQEWTPAPAPKEWEETPPPSSPPPSS